MFPECADLLPWQDFLHRLSLATTRYGPVPRPFTVVDPAVSVGRMAIRACVVSLFRATLDRRRGKLVGLNQTA